MRQLSSVWCFKKNAETVHLQQSALAEEGILRGAGKQKQHSKIPRGGT